MKKIFLFVFLMFMFILNVSAQACDSADIKRLKEMANGVEITYELQEPVLIIDAEVNDLYKINISGLTNDIFVYNETDDEVYDINTDLKNKIFFSGSRKLVVKANGCSAVLKKITLELPIYNSYSKSEFCLKKENINLDICAEWVDKMITEKDFNDVVYQKTSKEPNFVEKNFIFIIIFIVILIFIIGLIIYKRKKEVLV